jgi:formyltetrahydrofolate synthetase
LHNKHQQSNYDDKLKEKAKNNDKMVVVTSFCPLPFVDLKTTCALPLVIFCLSLSLEPYGGMQNKCF